MSNFGSKIKDSFSDFWTDTSMFFGKLFKRKKATDHSVSSALAVSDTPTNTAKSSDNAVETHHDASQVDNNAKNDTNIGHFKPVVEKINDVPVDEPIGGPVGDPVGDKTDNKPVDKSPTGSFKEKEKVKPLEKLPFALRFLRLSNRDLLLFYDEMATLIESSMTLIDSLLVVQAQSESKSVKKLYDEMIRHINGGMSLAETMYLFPKIFPSMQAALIEAGEKSGNLQKVLAQIAEELEGHQDFMRKIKGAMFYPVILLVLALTMVTGMMIFVIPKVAGMYKQSNAKLPTITQVVIDMSDYISVKYPIVLGSIFGTVLILYLFVSHTKIGQLLWEKFVSIIPVFGGINKSKNLMVFSANLGMLLQSGVLISEAFEITEKTMGNMHYERALNKIRKGIIIGKNISEMMGLEDLKTQKFKKNKLFPIQVAQMVHIGELTGSIDKMMMKIKENYHKSIDYTLKNISAMLEPIMIFIVALLVGSILLAVMMPFFYIGTTIS